jgi:xanthine dehydrogenase YagS FAD-binding subunit
VLVEVRFPATGPGTRSAYRESREKLSFDWATTAAAVRLGIEGGKIGAAKICLGAVAPVPVLAEAAAKSLIGKAPTREAFEEAAKLAYADARPMAHNAYKVQVGKATLVDALAAAAGTSDPWRRSAPTAR